MTTTGQYFAIGALLAACGGVEQMPTPGSGSGNGSAVTGPTDMLDLVVGWVARLATDDTSPDNLHFDYSATADAMVLRSNGELDVKSAIRVGNGGALTDRWWELGIDDGTAPSGIDFHASAGTGDYSARLARGAGTDGDFGLDNLGNGSIVLSTQHVPRMAITAAGNVTIGAADHGFKLEVDGPVSLAGITPFVKGGNNGTVTCTTFCAGANWPPGVGACLGGKNVDTGSYDYGCNTTLYQVTGDIACLCAQF